MWLAITLFHTAQAAPACVATDICSPSENPCIIDTAWQITDACTLDFGSNDLEIRTNGLLDAGSGNVVVNAGTLTIQGGGLRGRNSGNMNVNLLDDAYINGTVDFSTNGQAGRLGLHADLIWLMTPVNLGGTDGDADGGNLLLDGYDGVIIDGAVDQHGGDQAAGGELTILSHGPVWINAGVDVHGGRIGGGSLYVRTTTNVNVGAGTVDATGLNGGSGGSIELLAAGSLNILGVLNTNGSASGSVSGDGGNVTLRARTGLLRLGNQIGARGSAGDGHGGSVLITGGHDVLVDGLIDASSVGTAGLGGAVSITAGGDVVVSRPVSATGGSAGPGSIRMVGQSAVTIRQDINANGTGTAGKGGTIDLLSRNIFIAAGTLKARGAGAAAGLVKVEACAVNIGVAAILDTNTSGGTNTVISHDSLIIDGDLLAGLSNQVSWRVGSPMIGPTATITPAPTGGLTPSIPPCP